MMTWRKKKDWGKMKKNSLKQNLAQLCLQKMVTFIEMQCDYLYDMLLFLFFF